MNHGLGIFPASTSDAPLAPGFSRETRASNLADMTREPLDLLVIGAGVTGAGIARDAAMRGLRTAIVDMGDFASGSSSRSSRLVHGALRYLEHGHLRLVYSAMRERGTLLKIAPHLVWPRPFLIPLYEGTRLAPWKLAAALWIGDFFSLFRNVRRHRWLGKRALLQAEPRLKERGLRGGARHYDAVCDDARLALATVRSAHRHGALAANYAHVDHLDVADARVRGAWVTDLTSGDQLNVRASVVVNAAGPWSDAVRTRVGLTPALRTTKGAHVMVPRTRLGNREALTLLSPIDGRVLFVVPWGDCSYIGTTDRDCPVVPNEIYADADDVLYLLRSVNAYFPDARLTTSDVVAAWAGLRPLLASHRDPQPEAVPREHRVLVDPDGLISAVGGRLTTHRVMAVETVNVVAQQLHDLDGRPKPPPAGTDGEALPGGETRDLDVLVEQAVRDGFPTATAEYLVRAHGTETAAVTRLAFSDPRLAEPIVTGHPALMAEVVFAARREMAITLGDLLIRRTRIFHETPDHGLRELDRIADVAAAEMGWDATRRAAERGAYTEEVRRAEAFREDLERQ